MLRVVHPEANGRGAPTLFWRDRLIVTVINLYPPYDILSLTGNTREGARLTRLERTIAYLLRLLGQTPGEPDNLRRIILAAHSRPVNPVAVFSVEQKSNQ